MFLRNNNKFSILILIIKYQILQIYPWMNFFYRSIISKNEYLLELEDRWLISKLQRLINNVTKSLEH